MDTMLQADNETSYYRDLLYGGLGQSEIERSRLPDDGRWRTVVYVEIGDEYEEAAACSPDLFERESFLLREARARLKERMPDVQLCYIASHGCSSAVMILASEEGRIDGMRRRFEEYRNALSKNFTGVSIGVSASSQRLREIRGLFRQAEYLIVGSGKGGRGVAIAESDSGTAFTGRSHFNRRHMQLVTDIRNYIRQNATSIENVDQIAGVFYLSSRYANQLFKHYTGQTIFDFLVESRLEAAKKLLTAPKAKVYEVSEQIGYQNHSYFSSLFKQNTGLTPKQYMDIYGRTSG